MAERRENSVLFSLNELRNIESDRVRGEEEAEQARVEAERRAREDEIRKAREAEEAKRRAEEDRIRAEQQERERVAREGELRLKESERRAQIEAAAKLEQARIEAEARARIEGKKFPTMQVVGGVVALVVLAAGIMGYLVYSHNQEMARQQAEMQQKADAERKALLAQEQERQAALQKQIDQMTQQLNKANSEAERQQIRAQIAATVAQKSRPAPAARPQRAAASSKPAKTVEKKAFSAGSNDDPLNSLGL